jgi:catechol 2,3-dioxygenase-like lactoylglutathione lyase family enzyme
MHALIVRQPDGTLVDHVVLGVPDIQKGLDYVESLTGLRPFAGEVSAGATRSFVSARLNLGGKQFLEVVGPNPTFEGEPDGIGARAAALPGPRLVFWVMGVRDLGAYLRDAVRAGYPFNDTNHVRNGGYEYRMGAIDAEAAPHIPSVIEWKSRDDGEELAATVGSRIVDFTVHHPEAQKVQKVYDALGIGMLVRHGDEPRLRLVLETPTDDVILS